VVVGQDDKLLVGLDPPHAEDAHPLQLVASSVGVGHGATKVGVLPPILGAEEKSVMTFFFNTRESKFFFFIIVLFKGVYC
jgi:hypothetical protein